MNDDFLWHYAAGDVFFRILKDGFIRPRRNVRAVKKSILWLSSEPFWEKSVDSPDTDPTGNTRSLRKWIEQSNGLWRFGIPRHTQTPVLNWQELVEELDLSPKILNAIEAKARRRNANPLHWYGRFAPLPLWQCACIQTLCPETLAWESLSLNLFPYRLNAA